MSMKDRPSGRNPPSSDRLKITMKQQLRKENIDYGVFTSAINILQTLVVAIGAGLAVWGVINLLEGMEMTIPEPSHRESSSLWQVEVSF